MKLIRRHVRKISVILSLNFLFISCSQYENDNATSNSNLPTNQMLQRTNNFSGEDIFASIFFGMGEYAKSIPQLNKQSEITAGLTEENKTEILTKINLVTAEINRKDANFFSNFKKNISSSDQLIVKKAIEDGAFVIKENMNIIFPQFNKVVKIIRADIKSGKFKPYDQDNYTSYLNDFENSISSAEYDNLLDENMISESSLFTPLVLGFYFAVAVHNTIAVTALIYFKFAFWGPGLKKIGNNDQFGTLGNLPKNELEANLQVETLINEIAEYNAAQ